MISKPTMLSFLETTKKVLLDNGILRLCTQIKEDKTNCCEYAIVQLEGCSSCDEIYEFACKEHQYEIKKSSTHYVGWRKLDEEPIYVARSIDEIIKDLTK